MSSEKKLLGPIVIIGSDTKWGNSGVSGDMSAATITSLIQKIRNVDNVCMEVAWTGTPTGTFQLFGSITGNNWGLIQLTIPGPAGAAGALLLDLNQLSFPLIKLVYTKVSGTGTLVTYVGGKEI